MIHRGRTSERREKIPTPHKPRLSSCTSNAFTAICFSSPDMSILVVQVSALCFARRHSWILLVQCCRLGVLRRQYSERKVVVHASHSVLLRQQKTYTCHMYLSKSASADVDLRCVAVLVGSFLLSCDRRGRSGSNSEPCHLCSTFHLSLFHLRDIFCCCRKITGMAQRKEGSAKR